MSARKKEYFEKVEDSPKDRAYYENAIEAAIRDYYFSEWSADTKEAIDKTPHNAWVAALEYARKQCIVRGDLLTATAHETRNNKGLGGVVYNETYDTEKVGDLIAIYISLCFRYNKVPSVFGVSVLTGIERARLIDWGNKAERVSPSCREHARKKMILEVKAARAQSLENLAISGGKSALGCIAFLNNEIWRNGIEQPEEKEETVKNWELPVFNSETLEIECYVSNNGERPAPKRAEVVEVNNLGLPILG